MKFGYEGEGNRYGFKTMFLSHPADDLSPEQINQHMAQQKCKYLYINTPVADTSFYWHYRASLHCATIEVPLRGAEMIKGSQGMAPPPDFFIVADEPYHPDGSSLPRGWQVMPNVYIKVRVYGMESDEWEQKIEIANSYAENGAEVLFMPEYWGDVHSSVPELLGIQSDQAAMMNNVWLNLHSNVRMVPPMHLVLGMN